MQCVKQEPLSSLEKVKNVWLYMDPVRFLGIKITLSMIVSIQLCSLF